MILTNQSIILPAEDRHRMSRLYEEVRIRLEEMAMITARTLKTNARHNSEVKFCPSAADDMETVELIRTARGRGCYDYRQGACFELDEPGAQVCNAEQGRKI